MRTKGEKVIVGFDGKGNPQYVKRALDKETRMCAEMTRRIKKEQEILARENDESYVDPVADEYIDELKSGERGYAYRFGDPNCKNAEIDYSEQIEQQEHEKYQAHLESMQPIIDEMSGQKNKSNEKKNSNMWDIEAAAEKYVEELASGKRHDYTREDPTLSTFEVNYARHYAKADYDFVMEHLKCGAKNNNEESEQ